MTETKVLATDKGERMRLFLTEAGYKKALENQDRSFIKFLLPNQCMSLGIYENIRIYR